MDALDLARSNDRTRPERTVNPLSALYGAGVAARNALYDRGLLRAHHLQWPVVSVGSISAGGAGKTPFVMLLGRLLQQHGAAFDVLSRGYGRKDSAVRLVNASGSALDFGDEPLLIARELEVPVMVGADRFAAGWRTEKLLADARPAHGWWLHLLDDAFQHRRLARDINIVLLSQRDLQDRLLPVGRLREPFSALRRADFIVLTDALPESQLPPAAHGKPLWRVRRTVELASPAPEKVVAFCGVARPEAFRNDLESLNVRPAELISFPDHHHYSQSDIDRLRASLQRHGAEAFITTAKDITNLAAGGFLERLSLLIELRLRMQWVSPAPEQVFAAISEKFEARPKP